MFVVQFSEVGSFVMITSLSLRTPQKYFGINKHKILLCKFTISRKIYRGFYCFCFYKEKNQLNKLLFLQELMYIAVQYTEQQKYVPCFCVYFFELHAWIGGRDSEIGIATLLRAGWSADRIPLGFPSSLKWVSGHFPMGEEAGGRGVYHPPNSGTKVTKRVEIWRYALSATSWSVPGSNLRVCVFLLHFLQYSLYTSRCKSAPPVGQKATPCPTRLRPAHFWQRAFKSD